MVGLPNCRLHRRVLADLDRPAGKGDTPSLRTDSLAPWSRLAEAMMMRRRDFVTPLVRAAAWPLAAQEQQAGMPVVGYLSPRSPKTDASVLAAFRQGLSESGYIEGNNVTIELRWGHGRYDVLP